MPSHGEQNANFRFVKNIYFIFKLALRTLTTPPLLTWKTPGNLWGWVLTIISIIPVKSVTDLSREISSEFARKMVLGVEKNLFVNVIGIWLCLYKYQPNNDLMQFLIIITIPLYFSLIRWIMYNALLSVSFWQKGTYCRTIIFTETKHFLLTVYCVIIFV